jgi:HEAT repeat protein
MRTLAGASIVAVVSVVSGCDSPDPSRTTFWVEKAKSQDAQWRITAVGVLGARAKDEQSAQEALVRLIEDPDPRVRGSTILNLYWVADVPEIRRRIEARLSDENGAVREVASAVLQKRVSDTR